MLQNNLQYLLENKEKFRKKCNYISLTPLVMLWEVEEDVWDRHTSNNHNFSFHPFPSAISTSPRRYSCFSTVTKMCNLPWWRSVGVEKVKKKEKLWRPFWRVWWCHPRGITPSKISSLLQDHNKDLIIHFGYLYVNIFYIFNYSAGSFPNYCSWGDTLSWIFSCSCCYRDYYGFRILWICIYPSILFISFVHYILIEFSYW